MVERVLTMLDNAYGDYLIGNINQNEFTKRLGLALSTFPYENGKKNFTVQITSDKTGSEKFFGMRIFPNLEKLDNFCKELVNDDENTSFSKIIKKWRKIDEWFLEIDGNCFDRKMFNFNPKELTSLTLHEIGHVIYSDKPIEYFYRAYRDVKARLSVTDKATQKLMYDIYMIPLSLACMQRRWVNDKNEIAVEIFADKSVVELGYGQYLLEAIDKILKVVGSQNNNDRAEVESSVKWCQLNISDIMKRKEQLKDELYYRSIRTKSNYFKAMTVIILDKMGFKLRERYTGYAVENSVELLCDPKLMEKYAPIIDTLSSAKFDRALEMMISTESVAMESLLNRRKKIKAELPSQYELDTIAIEIDKITNNHDRIFVLDLIYEVLERVNNFEEAISPDPSLVRKWNAKVTAMKEQLEMLRQVVLSKKVAETSYKFFVKLPAAASDYEG